MTDPDVFDGLREESESITDRSINDALDRLEGESEQNTEIVESLEVVDTALEAVEAKVDQQYLLKTDPKTIADWTNLWKVTGNAEGEDFLDRLWGGNAEDPARKGLLTVLEVKNPAHRRARQIWRTKMSEHIISQLEEMLESGSPHPQAAEVVLKIMEAQRMPDSYGPEAALLSASIADEKIESRPERDRVSALMKAGIEVDSDQLDAIVEDYVASIKVLNGAGFVGFDYWDKLHTGFVLENFAYDSKHNRFYAQMKNGCEGNLVVLEMDEGFTLDDGTNVPDGNDDAKVPPLDDPAGNFDPDGDAGDQGEGLEDDYRSPKDDDKIEDRARTPFPDPEEGGADPDGDLDDDADFDLPEPIEDQAVQFDLGRDEPSDDEQPAQLEDQAAQFDLGRDELEGDAPKPLRDDYQSPKETDWDAIRERYGLDQPAEQEEPNMSRVKDDPEFGASPDYVQDYLDTLYGPNMTPIDGPAEVEQNFSVAPEQLSNQDRVQLILGLEQPEGFELTEAYNTEIEGDIIVYSVGPYDLYVMQSVSEEEGKDFDYRFREAKMSWEQVNQMMHLLPAFKEIVDEVEVEHGDQLALNRNLYQPLFTVRDGEIIHSYVNDRGEVITNSVEIPDGLPEGLEHDMLYEEIATVLNSMHATHYQNDRLKAYQDNLRFQHYDWFNEIYEPEGFGFGSSFEDGDIFGRSLGQYENLRLLDYSVSEEPLYRFQLKLGEKMHVLGVDPDQVNKMMSTLAWFDQMVDYHHNQLEASASTLSGQEMYQVKNGQLIAETAGASADYVFELPEGVPNDEEALSFYATVLNHMYKEKHPTEDSE